MSLGTYDLALYPKDAMTTQARNVTQMVKNDLVPVAAPHLVEALQRPEDLQQASLIHDIAWKRDWQSWLEGQQIRNVDAGRGASYSLYSLAVERCVAGDGVLIGHTALLAAHLGDGRLVQLFPDRRIAGPAICLGTPGAQATPLLRAVEAALGAAAGETLG